MTVIATFYGLFEFLRMLFGQRNIAQIFKRFTNNLLRGLPFAPEIIIDLLIFNPDLQSHG